MPRISAFYGVTIWMYWDEGAHARPHFHARYGEYQASVDFDGEVVVGRLPLRALDFVDGMGAPPPRRAPGQLGSRTSEPAPSPDRAAGLAWAAWIGLSMSPVSR